MCVEAAAVKANALRPKPTSAVQIVGVGGGAVGGCVGSFVGGSCVGDSCVGGGEGGVVTAGVGGNVGGAV